MKVIAYKSTLAFLFTVLIAFNGITQCADVIVAQDDSGDVKTIQEAIDLCPVNNADFFTIYVKNGVYDEKLFFEKNFIKIIGEDREQTIITTAVLRRLWRENNPSDWGAATINIKNGVHDLTFANLTIRNNFADVYPDVPDNNDHTFAIRGGGDKIIIYNCNVIATGGDTLSLWNTDGGRYFHKDCYFEGYVDYVCPRGYCYIENCQFYGYNNHASIWHDGSGGEDHKFVIRDSHFDGVQGFALGRHHKEAAFYLLDCTYSKNMKTSPGFTYVGTTQLNWGLRYYYYNTHGPLIDFPWHYDNLEEAAGTPDADQIDALWTFNGTWDPVSLLDGLLPFSSYPTPGDLTACAGPDTELNWKSAFCADTYEISLGTDSIPDFLAETTENSYAVNALETNTQYFWKVDAIKDGIKYEGETWSFKTDKNDDLPYKAFKPYPASGSDYMTNIVKMDWEYWPCSSESFDIYVGTDSTQLEFKTTQKYPAYFLFISTDNTKYYWRVDSKNGSGITTGDIWNFTLNPETSSSHVPGDKDDAGSISAISPNPIEAAFFINYKLNDPAWVEIEMYSELGKKMNSWEMGYLRKGKHVSSLSVPGELAEGIYFCVLRQNGLITGKKRVILL